jgi:hypothetical protein
MSNDREAAGSGQAKAKAVEIHVNEQPVIMPDNKATGSEIKEVAIAQGVKIEMDFVLSEELSHGRMRIVGDDERVTLTKQSRFDAIPNDDHS